MNFKRGRLLFALFIFVAIIFAVAFPKQFTGFFILISDIFSVGSIHLGIFGDTAESLLYISTFTSDYGTFFTGDSSDYSAHIGFFPLPNATSSQTESSTSTSSTSASGSSGSSGSSASSPSCTYDWICTEWYPYYCPEEEIQNRLCVNKGTCDGILEMPETERTCLYTIPQGPLFDIFAKIPFGKKQVLAGGILEPEISLINVGDIKQLDVFFKYWIVNENNKLIAEVRETRAITEKDKFVLKINLPSDIKLGSYKFFVEIEYDSGKTALASDSFRVVNKIQLFTLGYSILISFFIALVITSFVAYKLFRKR